jgi:hypothetical protein
MKADPVTAEARDRQVGDDAPACVEELGIDNPARRNVEVVVAHALQQRERPRPFDFDLAERREIKQAGAFPHGGVLLPQALEEGRRSPLPVGLSLVGAGPSPRATGLDVVHALPAVLLAEDSATLLQTSVDRADPARPGPFVLVVREAEVVVVLDAFAGPLGGVERVGVVPGEAPSMEGKQIE